MTARPPSGRPATAVFAAAPTTALSALALAVLLMAPRSAFAWGPEGHRAVAQAAEDALSPETRARVRTLTGGASLAAIATRLDDRKERPEWFWSRALHYVNVPQGHDTIDRARDCPEGRCAIAAVEHFAHKLADRQASPAERLEAIEMVVHIVADIHQPLHVSYAHDHGGNDHTVVVDGRRVSLHALWDDVVGARAAGGIVAASGAGGQPLAWAEESLALVRAWVYAAGAGEALPAWYLDRATREARARMDLAAGRLAAVLEASMSGAPLGFADPVAAGYSRERPGWLTMMLYRAGRLGTGGVALLGGGLLALIGGVWLLWRRRRRFSSQLFAAI